MTDEGAIQLLRQGERGGECIFAAVGKLQFEVVQHRLKDEYGVETVLSPLSYQCSAWVQGDLKTFKKAANSLIVQDRLDRTIVLFTSQWEKDYTIQQNPQHKLLDIIA